MLLRGGKKTSTTPAATTMAPPNEDDVDSQESQREQVDEHSREPPQLSPLSDNVPMSLPQTSTPPPSNPNPPETVPQHISPPQVVYVQRERSIRRFFGEAGEYPAEEFQSELERTWRAQPGLTKVQKMDLIWGNIGPAVLAELKCQDREIQEDPDKALKKLVEIFGERRSPSQLLQQMYSLQQWAGESVRSYSHRLSSIYQALTRKQKAIGGDPIYQDVIVRDHFQQSLQDPILVKMLRDRVFVTPSLTFKDIREVAIRWTDDLMTNNASSLLQAPTQQAATSSGTCNEIKELKNTVDDLTKKLDSLIATQLQQPRQRIPQRKQIVCYGCGKMGHFRRDCREGNGRPPRS